MKIFSSFIQTIFLFFITLSAVAQSKPEQTTVSWGDQGNGTYINPILNADYSDPDAIRVGDDYYMICSEFHFMGMPVLHSKDLVNWKIIARVFDRIDFNPAYDTNDRYSGGSWAPSIRYHDNKFWIYFCTIDEGLFMTTADKPEGPWAPLTQVVKTDKWEDPCPFWDEDGQAYLIRSRHRAGPLILHKMSPDGEKLLDDGVTIYTGPVAEGPKINKWNGYYYISTPEGGVGEGWQTVLRSKNIYGPYEKMVVLEKGTTNINGPHQGALVDTPNGEWWFIHFQMLNRLGRVVHLEPVHWQNDWPVIGVDIDRNGIGEPVYVWKKPDVGTSYPIEKPQASDEFNAPELDFQWAWNHNPVPGKWSLTQKPGFLLLNALPAASFLKAKNTLTQKIMGNSGEATTLLLADQMKDGQKAGLCQMGKPNNLIGLVRSEGKLSVFADLNGKVIEMPVKTDKIFLQIRISPEQGKNQFYYSVDNKKFIPFGETFIVNYGNWKGPKIGLFSYNEKEKGGTAKFDWFHYIYDGS